MVMQPIVTWVLALSASLGIRGGELNPPPEHPVATSTVALLVDGQIQCSGVLIGPHLVATAGHCVPPDRDVDFQIYFGHEETESPKDQEQMRPAVSWASYYHPDYEDLPELLMLKDLGWVRFSGEIPEPPPGYAPLKPIGVASRFEMTPGESYAIGGFGIDESGQSARRYGTSEYLHKLSTRSTGELALMKGHPAIPCPADSGSGLFAKVPNFRGELQWQLLGIASEIFFTQDEDRQVAHWSSASQCEFADQAAYVMIGEDIQWLYRDSYSFPARVIPDELLKWQDVPEPNTLRELCEYPNALDPLWLTTTAIIHAVRDQYFFQHAKAPGFCKRFEQYVTGHLQSSGGELILSFESDLIGPHLSGRPDLIPVQLAALRLTPHLKHLKVQGASKLFEVEALKELTELKTLTLQGEVWTQGGRLQQVLQEKPLESLDITLRASADAVAAWGPAQLSDLTGVKAAQIDLTVTHIKNHELDFSTLRALRHLTLKFAPEYQGELLPELPSGLISLALKDYPKSTWQLGPQPALEHLFVWGGSLTEVSLSDFPQLVSLVVDGAPLAALHAAGEPSPLKWLTAKSGHLTELPESFGSLTELIFLDLRGQRLSQLPESFKNLSALRFLNLSGNEFQRMPQQLLSLQVDYLDLSRNAELFLTPSEDRWARSLMDFVGPSSGHLRIAHFYRGDLLERERRLRQEMGDFIHLSRRALY